MSDPYGGLLDGYKDPVTGKTYGNPPQDSSGAQYGGLPTSSDPYGGLLNGYSAPVPSVPSVPVTPVSFDQATSSSPLGGLLGFLGNAAKEVPNIIGGIGKTLEAIPGAVVNAANGFNTSAEPTTGMLGSLSQAANQVGQGAQQFAKGEIQGAHNLVANPGQQLGVIANNAYEHPLSALMNVSGVGDLAGAGVRAAGDIAGNEALSAAGQTIRDASGSLNPVQAGVNVARSVKNAGGAATRGTLRLTTASGAAGGQALKDIASGGELGKSTLTGARGLPTTEEQQAFEDAARSIDESHAGNASLFSPDEIGLVQQGVSDALANKGVNLTVMTPQEQNVVSQWLDYRNSDLPSSGVKSPQGNQLPNTSGIGLESQAQQIYQKYFPGLADDPATLGGKYGSVINRSGIPNSVQMATMFQDAIDRNGLLGYKQGINEIPSDQLGKIIDKVVTPSFKLGGRQGFEANAVNLNRLKKNADSYFNRAPLENSQKTVNSLSQDLSGAVSSPLRQYPEYNAVMQRYQAYHRGEALQGFAPGPIQSLLRGNKAGGGGALEGVAAVGAGHYFGPAAVAGISATSPRLMAELSNLYGKSARGYGTVTSPIVSSLSNPVLAALLTQIGLASQQQ